MALLERQAAGAGETAASPVATAAGPLTRLRRRRADLLVLAGLAAIVTLIAQVPVLHTHTFYYWDDSASVFLPTWHVIGDQLRAGHFPLLDVDMWMGGNWAGEAQLGIFNPLLLANALMVSLLPDMAVAAILIKTEFLVILAAGVYLVAREYGSARGPAVVVATALPFSGYTLYWDAQNWAASLIAFAFLPHVWWTARRFARGRLHPVVPLVVGILAMTSGSPYAALGVVIVLVGVAVERLVLRDVRSVARLAVVGLAVGLTGAVVFLPLLGVRSVGWRTQGDVVNDFKLVTGLDPLLNLSVPAYVPNVASFGPPSTPITYLAWFVAPLLPWYRWSALRRWRPRAGVLVLGGTYLLLLLGPSNLWLFRWPARLIEYVYLPVCVLVAVLLSAGLRTDHPVRRAVLSAVLIAVGTYVAWATFPVRWRIELEATLLEAALVALVLLAHRYRRRLVVPGLVLGTVAVLAVQVHWFPGNTSVTPWHFPHNVAALRADFAERTDGNTLTVLTPDVLFKDDMRPDRVWRQVVFGNVNQLAGIPSLNSYTGMGNRAFADELCMNYHGGVCPEGYQKVFAVDPATSRPLADLLRLRTVVVANGYLPGRTSVTDPPRGWAVSRRNAFLTEVRRMAPLPYPQGRVSYTDPSVGVTGDRVLGPRDEELTYTGCGRFVVAALAWPGWTATVDGRPVPVTAGPAGLIQLDLPQRTTPGTVRLSFTPAGLRPGLALYLAGLLLGLGYCVMATVRRRRARRTPGADPAGAGPPAPPVGEPA
jgi:hypothetical protein